MFVMLKEDAVKLFGTQYRLAKELGLTQQAVSAWKSGEPIPGAHAYRIRYELKPEAFEGKEGAAA